MSARGNIQSTELESPGWGADMDDARSEYQRRVDAENAADDAVPTNWTAYTIVAILGLGLLISWNSVLLAHGYSPAEELLSHAIGFTCTKLDYFDETFPGSNIAFYVPLAYIVPQLPLLVLMVNYGHHFSYTSRILWSFALVGVVLILMPFLAHYSKFVVLGLTVLLGVATAVLQPSLFGFTSQLPGIYSQGVMAGQGVAGIMASVLRIVTKASLPGKGRESATIYFMLAASSIIACIAGFIYLVRMDFTKYYLRRSGHADHRDDRVPLVDDEGGRNSSSPSTPSSVRDFSDGLRSPLVDNAEISRVRESSASHQRSVEELRTYGAAIASGDETPAERKSSLQICIDMWEMCLAVYLVFTMTFIVFPGETGDIAYRETIGLAGLGKHNWWFVVLLATFNVIDTIGRSLPAVVEIPYRAVLVGSVLRFGLVPLFIFATKSSSAFFNDIVNFVVMVIFALSNGYLSTSGFIQGPRKLDPESRERAGFLLGMFLQFGIFSGSMLALGAERI